MKKTLVALCASAFVFAELASASNSGEGEKVVQEAKRFELKTFEDFDAALKEAKAEGKKLLLDFTGSKWCPPCKMMDSLVLKTEKFAEYAKDKLKVVVADFSYDDGPVSKKFGNRHIELAQQFKITGFPTLILIDPKSGENVRFEGLKFSTPEELIAAVEKFGSK